MNHDEAIPFDDEGLSLDQLTIQGQLDLAHAMAREVGALGFFRGALLATVEQVEDEILADLHRLPVDGAATGETG